MKIRVLKMISCDNYLQYPPPYRIVNIFLSFFSLLIYEDILEDNEVLHIHDKETINHKAK